jgi:hypothetical protein
MFTIREFLNILFIKDFLIWALKSKFKILPFKEKLYANKICVAFNPVNCSLNAIDYGHSRMRLKASEDILIAKGQIIDGSDTGFNIKKFLPSAASNIVDLSIGLDHLNNVNRQPFRDLSQILICAPHY